MSDRTSTHPRKATRRRDAALPPVPSTRRELHLTLGDWDPEEPEVMSAALKAFLVQELDTFPVDLVRIDEVNYFLSVYWHESSGETGLAVILRFLNACIDITPHEISDDSLLN